MLRRAALSWWQCASRILCHHANAARRSPQLSSTLGCRSTTSALPPPLNTKPMRRSRQVVVKPRGSCNQIRCGAAPANSAFTSPALSRLGIDQSVSLSHGVLRGSVGCKLLDRRSRTRDRASLAYSGSHHLGFSLSYSNSSCAKTSARSALCASELCPPVRQPALPSATHSATQSAIRSAQPVRRRTLGVNHPPACYIESSQPLCATAGVNSMVVRVRRLKFNTKLQPNRVAEGV